MHPKTNSGWVNGYFSIGKKNIQNYPCQLRFKWDEFQLHYGLNIQPLYSTSSWTGVITAVILRNFKSTVLADSHSAIQSSNPCEVGKAPHILTGAIRAVILVQKY